MYLTAGQYKGIKIETPPNTKPTLSKVRESVFNMLFSLNKEGCFLDMFAGSAIMGMEALSRGFIVKEIEISKKTAQIIKKNYKKINIEPDISICDALKFNQGKYDVIYIDPPWDMDYFPIIEQAKKLLNTDGIIVIEHEKELILPDKLQIIKSKKYGRCKIDLIKHSI